MRMKEGTVKEIEKFYSELEDSLYKKTDELFLETRDFISRKFYEKIGLNIKDEEIWQTKDGYELAKEVVLGESYLAPFDSDNGGDYEIDYDDEIEEFFKEKFVEFTGWDTWYEYDKYFSEYAYKSFISLLLKENKEGLVKNLYKVYGKAYSSNHFYEAFQEWRQKRLSQTSRHKRLYKLCLG
ncbi:MAG: hypothetical protein ACTTJ1_08720 [Treponema sp.]